MALADEVLMWLYYDVVWTHGGFMDGVRSMLYFWPNESAGAVILTNGIADEHHTVVGAAMQAAVKSLHSKLATATTLS